jgi:hypothetical protein
LAYSDAMNRLYYGDDRLLELHRLEDITNSMLA